MKTHYKFKTSVDSDIKQIDNNEFNFLVSIYLNDPDGWNSKGYTFENTEIAPDVFIHLATPDTIQKKCGLPKDLSCAMLGGNKMYLNAYRWINGSKNSKLDLENYRQYMVSHEIGHILGFEHESCPCPGCLSPIMMQQTLGIGKCIPNTKITDGNH